MGSVAMGEGGSWIFEGYRITQTAYCLYCDKCGSFKIMTWIPIPKWVILVGYCLTPAVAMKMAWHPALTFCGATILLFALMSDTFRHLVHICKHCGNSHITRDNVLNYLEDDQSVLDVSYEKTIKYYVEY